MGKVIMSGIVPPLVKPCPYDPVFGNNTWADIIAACQSNNIPETWLVGDQKAMTINGTDYLIDIIGKNHDDYADGSGKAPLTFQMHDLYVTKYQMNSSATNAGGWTSCKMRTTHLNKIMSLMPSEVQSGIKEVNKLTSAGSQSSTIKTTSDKLFLLSEIELFGYVKYSFDGEGKQYDYYAAGNSVEKETQGSSARYWIRSPVGSFQSGSFCYLEYLNSVWCSYATGAQSSLYVAPAFCF